MASSNLIKSEEGWRRFKERTANGRRARQAFMRHTPLSALPEHVERLPKRLNQSVRDVMDEIPGGLIESDLPSFQPRLKGRRHFIG